MARPVQESGAFLDGMRDAVEEIAARTEESFADLALEQLNWRPGPEAWSVGLCLEHLLTTNRAYATTLEPAIARARERGSRDPGTFRGGAFGGWFARALGPDSGRRYKVPGRFAPTVSQVDAGAVAEFVRHQREELIPWIDAARGLDLDRVRVRSPAAPIFFRLGDVYSIIVGHERRHLAQAGRVRTAPGFPG